MMLNSIFNYKLKMHDKGRNHLYDDVDNQEEIAKEFTIDDLKTDQIPINN